MVHWCWRAGVDAGTLTTRLEHQRTRWVAGSVWQNHGEMIIVHLALWGAGRSASRTASSTQSARSRWWHCNNVFANEYRLFITDIAQLVGYPYSCAY